jgi:hypothetical protein
MTDTSRIPPRLLAARAVPAARRKLRCAASVLFVSFLALFTLVAAAGAQAPASLSSDFSGASLDPAVWQSPSPAGSAVLQSGKLRLVNGFLNTVVTSTVDNFMFVEFKLRIDGTPAQGEVFKLSVSPRGVPGWLVSSENVVMLRAFRGTEPGSMFFTGPQASEVLDFAASTGTDYTVRLMFREGDNRFRIFINGAAIGAYYTCGSGFNPSFSTAMEMLYQVRLRSLQASPSVVVLDDFRLFGQASSPELVAQWSTSANLDFAQAQNRGTLTRFYRGTQIQGQGMKNSAQGLLTVPDAWLSPDRSFPYLKRPFAKEVFFADTLSFVRFCGGWNPNVGVWGENTGVQGVGDLAVETDGVVSYRFGAVKERIDPFIEQGYTDLIFSIDNVPYDMAVKRDGQPVIHFYGQAAGPRSAGEWRDFMQGLGEELVRLYPDYARGWRYRVGTECNGGSRFSDTVTFWGSNLEYRAWYEATYEGLSAAFGQTPMVGPGEYSGQITIAADDKRDKDPVDYLDLAVYAQQALSPLSFVANSSHAIPRFNDSGSLVGLADPNERVDSTVSGFQTWLAAEPSLASSDKYIFQFGILQSELTHNGVNLDAGGEPGGRGAAWTMHCLFELWEQLGFKGIWHWDTTDTLTASGMSNQYLLKSNGWLYTILDHLAGGTVHSLPVARDDAGTSYKPVLVRKGDSTYLLLSAFNLSREALPARRVEVQIPEGLLPPDSLDQIHASWVSLTEENSVFRTIRNELEAGGLLTPGFVTNPRQLSTAIGMGGTSGRTYARQNYDRFAQMETDSLTLKNFLLTEGNTQDVSGGTLTLGLDVTPGSVAVIALAAGVSTALTAPADGATFVAPATIELAADASSAEGTIAKVEFFQGESKLGEDTSSPYTFTWSNVAAGAYTLTAKASDQDGATTTSAAVNITVTAALSPYEQWKAGHGLTGDDALDDADPDGDGHVNLLEYALGGNPKAPDSLPMTFSSSEPYLSLSATKNSTATDLAWGAEVSGDLSVWSPATITLDTLTQFQAMDTIPVSGAAKRFIRVKISKPQAMVEP